MLSIILFILIGIKLDMMNGLYLALVITEIVLWIIDLIIKMIKIVLKVKGVE